MRTKISVLNILLGLVAFPVLCLAAIWLRNPDFLHLERRAKVSSARHAMNRIAQALDQYPPAQLPARLADVQVSDDPNPVSTVDPFTGQEYLYEVDAVRQRWYLVSPAFDGRVDSDLKAGVFIQYDPTNGTVSGGDIVISSGQRAGTSLPVSAMRQPSHGAQPTSPSHATTKF